MSRLRRRLLWVLLQVAVLVGAHAALLTWFAGGEVSSVLFTGGHQVSPGVLFGAGSFFLVRLLLFLLLPGVVLAQLLELALPRGGGAEAPSDG